MNRLVYFEETDDVTAAIQRERQLKGTRKRKFDLIASMNPRWLNLSDGWFETASVSFARSFRVTEVISATESSALEIMYDI
jgi:hypothetical protein